MAEYEQKDMTGSLFNNDKGDNEKRPDMRGSATINGTKYSVSAWENESKQGKKYLSLKIQEYNAKLDDEIPF